MASETKTCQNCKSPFTIEPEDFAFYEKIHVPPPTWCPQCRLRRRLTYRNEHGFSRRKCAAPGHEENIISTYSDPKVHVVDRKFWWSDEWDPGTYGRDYDFTKPFFMQFRELLETVPLIALTDSKSSNSEYCHLTVEMKGCYLVTATWNSEDCCYGNRLSHCKDTIDSYVCFRTEFGYENVYCRDSYQLFWSDNCEGCHNSYFLYDCRGCSNCICCTSLHNKQYHIFNKPYSKEEYGKKVQEMNLGSRNTLHALRKTLAEMRLKAVHRYAQIYQSTNVSGDNIEQSRNCRYCFDVMGNAEDSKYCNWSSDGMKTCYDSGPGSGGKSELTYEGVSIGVNNSRCNFGVAVWYSHDVHYSYGCDSSQYLFGCVSLRNKRYCILNKQYSEEEYSRLLSKVIRHMQDQPYVDARGREYRYGEYFPSELSPYAYNETVAQDFFPIAKEQAEKEGYVWRDPSDKNYVPTIPSGSLPETILDVPDSITGEILECGHRSAQCVHQCTGAFRVIPQELLFYKKFNLPLPSLCPNCRHYERLKLRNPLKLWRRTCECEGQMSKVSAKGGSASGGNGQNVYRNTGVHQHGTGKCPNEFETSYSPERQEIIYCEQCYQQEIA